MTYRRRLELFTGNLPLGSAVTEKSRIERYVDNLREATPISHSAQPGLERRRCRGRSADSRSGSGPPSVVCAAFLENEMNAH